MTTLVLTVIGDDRSGIVNTLAEVVASHDGNWERSSMSELAGAFAGIVVVTLPEGRAADFTAAVQALPDLTIVVHDVDAAEAEEPDSRITVELLALAHERACEAELAGLIETDLDAGRLPDMAALRACFAPDAAALPAITIRNPTLSAYEGLAASHSGDAA